ncbi:unnamed protein product [Danaus chrysippus]|uniref:(African queen) hypothetical protein n=1 Tax=Danaus chrysippus TaxID=151541 RepID=A0A8J2R685_9NEOP|nr:unnamed protein product [Danaus chrysippus]
MEISAGEWESKARANITKYVHRGGECKGDDPQLIGGSDFLNTIGIAMGLPTSDPDHWTKYEREQASKGELVFYEGKSREAIDVVAKQIRSCCGGDDKNFITVLPIELYYNGKLYELPLFRIKRYKDSQNYYVDNVGRCYGSYDNWYNFNKLPPGEMAYPANLRLSLNSHTKQAYVVFSDTPSSRLDAQAARGVDTVAAVAGLASSAALLFVSGGLAAPLVATSLVTAGWGTSRATYQIAERAAHGESVNPFTNSESRMLWLGVAASLTSFGAMGASMRLSSLAARGREISNAFKLVTDIANGANVAISGLAILNTSIFMYQHRDDLTAADVLMYGASVAFWSKGVFCYKSANTIIKESQNYAFAHINKQLNQDQASEMNQVRSRFGDDPALLRKFIGAMEKNISVKDYSQILIDGMKYADIVSSLNDDQIQAFDSFRNHLRDDIKLISGIRKISEHYNINPGETIENIINLWQGSGGSSQIVPIASDTMLKDGNLILGRAPPIKITDLPQLTPPMIRFLGDLSQMDVAASAQWSSAVPILLTLQSRGLFTTCPVVRVVAGGNAVVSLNSVLDVSIHKLYSIPDDDCKTMLHLIGNMSPTVSSDQITGEVRTLCIVKYRLRFECQRNESVTSITKILESHKTLQNLVKSNLQSHEKDRLYTYASTISLNKADIYMNEMLTFVAELKPTNVSELVAYSEYVMNTVQEECVAIKMDIKNGKIVLPKNTKLSVWTRQEACRRVFGDRARLVFKYRETLKMVRENGMVGETRLGLGLSDDELLHALRGAQLRFGSEPSAVYHSLKHATEPPHEYVKKANETVRSGRARVTLAQDGRARLVSVDDGRWTAYLLEDGGRALLASYMHNK